MEMLNRKELKGLAENPKGPCVSVFMPTHFKGPETQQNPIRLKNLLREAEQRLVELEIRPVEARELLAPAAALLDDADFWQHQSNGLALFMAEGFFRYYQLPLSFEELTVVTSRFHLKPLLALFNEDGQYYILALSQEQIRLLECTRHRVTEIPLADTSIPTNIREALRYDDDLEKHQFRSNVEGGVAFHGQESGKPSQR